jgi:hypothetical protein
MVWNDKQLCGIWERLVFGKPTWIRVTVGADDWQIPYIGVKTLGDGTGGGV